MERRLSAGRSRTHSAAALEAHGRLKPARTGLQDAGAPSSMICLFFAAAMHMPPVGIIDFYGLHKTSRVEVERALGVNLTGAQERLGKIPGVERGRLNYVCCESGKTILYVGIQEKGAPALTFRPAPHGKVRLPKKIIETSASLDAALDAAVLRGNATEDDSQGHASNDPAARVFQERFIRFAAHDLAQLRDVLQNSSDAHHRAVAAEVIAYSADKSAIAGDLIAAMRDPDSEVRNNAMRALGVIALHTPVPPDAFIDPLQSIVWTDRNKAAAALVSLTADRDPNLIRELRERALPSLIEMARWKSPGHAEAAFIIVGRIAGLPEQEIFDAWDRGDRESVIEKARSAGFQPGG
jgi:hypothetical protein